MKLADILGTERSASPPTPRPPRAIHVLGPALLSPELADQLEVVIRNWSAATNLVEAARRAGFVVPPEFEAVAAAMRDHLLGGLKFNANAAPSADGVWASALAHPDGIVFGDANSCDTW